MLLPNGEEYVLPDLVLPTIIFLVLGVGVGLGIVISVCLHAICIVQSPKSNRREDHVELNSIVTHPTKNGGGQLIKPKPVINRINPMSYSGRYSPVRDLKERRTPDIVDYPTKHTNSIHTDYPQEPRTERLKIPHPKVIETKNVHNKPIELSFLHKKIFSNHMPRLHYLELDENIYDDPRDDLSGKDISPERGFPEVSSGGNQNIGAKPELDDMMNLCFDILHPLLDLIDDSKSDSLQRRIKAKELLYTFLKKCQMLRSPEKVNDLDCRTAILLDHPSELQAFCDALGGLMSRTIKDPHFIFSSGEEVKMLESFFKTCDEKQSPEKLEALCQSILRRLNLEIDH